MGKAKQFAQNSLWLIVSTASVVIVGIVYRPVIGRVLGPEQYGRYSFIITFVTYFIIVAHFGVRSVVSREIGRDPGIAHAYLKAACKIRALTTLIALIACGTTGYLLNRGPEVTLGIVVFSLSIVALAFGDLLEGALIAFQKSLYVAVANLIGNLSKLLVGLWALRAGYGLLGVLWVFVFTSIVTTLLNWYFTTKTLQKEKHHSSEPGTLAVVLKESVPFFVLSIASKLYAKNDILFLSLLKGDRVTGIYSAAYVFIDLLISASNSFTFAAYPMVACIYGGTGKESMKLAEVYERLHKHMLMVFLPISVLLTVFGLELLVLVFGTSYQAGVSAMRVLVWVPPLEVSCLVSGNFLSATYRQGLEARIAASVAVLNVIVTVTLIIAFGAIGAAVATIGASVVNTVVRYIYVRRSIGVVSLIDVWGKPTACAGMLLAALLVFSHAHWALRLAIGFAACLAAIIVVKPYDSQDRRLIMSIMKR